MSYTRILLSAAALTLAVMTAGCGTTAVLSEAAGDPNTSESILIFKMTPDNYRFQFFPGRIEGDYFVSEGMGMAVVNAVPSSGYVVVKVPVGQVMALTQIQLNPSPLGGDTVDACGGRKALTVRAPSSGVYYVADIEAVRKGQLLSRDFTISLTHKTDLQSAAEFLAKNFPKIKVRPAQSEYSFLSVAKPCAGSSPIPIVIPIPVRAR